MGPKLQNTINGFLGSGGQSLPSAFDEDTYKPLPVPRSPSMPNLEKSIFQSDMERAIAMSLTEADPQIQRALAESMKTESTTTSVREENEEKQSVEKPEISKEHSDLTEFTPFCDEELLRQRQDLTQYELRSVVRHLGPSYQSGHYVADVLTRGDKEEWKRHDDQYVSSMTTENATNAEAQKNAYIFFYVHRAHGDSGSTES